MKHSSTVEVITPAPLQKCVHPTQTVPHDGEGGLHVDHQDVDSGDVGSGHCRKDGHKCPYCEPKNPPPAD